MNQRLCSNEYFASNSLAVEQEWLQVGLLKMAYQPRQGKPSGKNAAADILKNENISNMLLQKSITRM